MWTFHKQSQVDSQSYFDGERPGKLAGKDMGSLLEKLERLRPSR
jgi:hypothetical protein